MQTQMKLSFFVYFLIVITIIIIYPFLCYKLYITEPDQWREERGPDGPEREVSERKILTAKVGGGGRGKHSFLPQSPTKPLIGIELFYFLQPCGILDLGPLPK